MEIENWIGGPVSIVALLKAYIEVGRSDDMLYKSSFSKTAWDGINSMLPSVVARFALLRHMKWAPKKSFVCWRMTEVTVL